MAVQMINLEDADLSYHYIRLILRRCPGTWKWDYIV